MLTKNITSLDKELNYRCYEFNRRRSPSIKAEEWADFFPNWQEFETRMFSDHIERNKIVFPSKLMAAHYMDNWQPANYDLGEVCCDCREHSGTELLYAWDGGVDLYCLPCAGAKLNSQGYTI